jgi:hypothetical protein
VTLLLSLLTTASAVHVTAVPPSQWGAADADLGVFGSEVEDFEDATLLPGLEITVDLDGVAPVDETWTTLPALFDPVVDDGGGAAFVSGVWDGQRVVTNTLGNQVGAGDYSRSSAWHVLTFELAGGADLVALSLQQMHPNTAVVVDGVNLGGIGALGLTGGSDRGGYLILRREPGEDPITSVALDNVVGGVPGDGFAVDHLRIVRSAAAPYIFRSFAPASWGADDATLGLSGHLVEDFEDTRLSPGITMSIDEDARGAFDGSYQALATVFDPLTDPFGNAFVDGNWDGDHVFLNTLNQVSGTYSDASHWRTASVQFDSGVVQVGFSLQQAGTDIGLRINGVDRGPLSLIAPNLQIGGGRNGYLVIEAPPGADPITSLTWDQVGHGNDGDGFAIDHLAYSPELCAGDPTTGDPDGNGVCGDLDVEVCDGVDGDDDGDADELGACRCLPATLDGQDYVACRETTDWQTAEQICANASMTLVQFETFQEKNRVARATSRVWPGRVWWLGANDLDTEGDYRWLSGAPFTPLWAPSEPTGADEDCLAFFSFYDVMYDTTCARELPFICEAL